MNFGEIKYTYNSLLAESLSNNLSDGKVAFKKYIKSIKENAVLKTQFDIYYNLENKVESQEEFKKKITWTFAIVVTVALILEYLVNI